MKKIIANQMNAAMHSFVTQCLPPQSLSRFCGGDTHETERQRTASIRSDMVASA
ncbi:hypothetical protein ACC720_17515 [Rhizobium ruizarguesonis]